MIPLRHLPTEGCTLAIAIARIICQKHMYTVTAVMHNAKSKLAHA